MSKIHKYKIWDKEKKEWFKPIYEAYKGNLEDLSISLSGELLRRTSNMCAEHESNFPDRYEIVDYLDIPDKNGKEICEGDIVTTFGTNKGVVKWNRFAWFVGDEFIDANGQAHEIVGNIYENPDLTQ